MAKEFDTLNEALEQQRKDDTYSQFELSISMHELAALKEGKALYATDGMGKSIVLSVSGIQLLSLNSNAIYMQQIGRAKRVKTDNLDILDMGFKTDENA